MNRQFGLFIVALILCGAYLYFFTDLFRSKRAIEIYAQVRPSFPSSRHGSRDRNAEKPPTETDPVTFTLDDDYRLTELKVVEAEDFKTNKYPHALWHLISDSNSVPTKGIVYGMKIRGMKPSSPRGRAEPLHTNTVYMLLIEAGKQKGEVNFKTREATKRG